MAVEASGTQSATVTTEHTLTTETDAGKKLVLYVDLANLAGGATPDIVELRVKRKVLTGDTAATVQLATFVGGLVIDPIVASIPINNEFQAIFTLKQTQGSAGRDFKWSVESL